MLLSAVSSVVWPDFILGSSEIHLGIDPVKIELYGGLELDTTNVLTCKRCLWRRPQQSHR